MYAWRGGSQLKRRKNFWLITPLASKQQFAKLQCMARWHCFMHMPIPPIEDIIMLICKWLTRVANVWMALWKEWFWLNVEAHINCKRCASLLIRKELWHESKLSFNFKVSWEPPIFHVFAQGYNQEFGCPRPTPRPPIITTKVSKRRYVNDEFCLSLMDR